jgi:hypothetical protein
MTHKKVDDSQATLVRAEHEQVEELRAEVKAQALSIARLRQIVQELVTAANVLTIRASEAERDAAQAVTK